MNKIWKTPISIEEITQVRNNTMAGFLGIEFIEIGDHYLKAKMEVNERTIQPLGIMHGGASCVLAETVGSIAANYCVDRNKQVCVGLSINTNHIRMIKAGSYVIGIAHPIHIGKTTQVWEIKITNPDDDLISVTRLTLAVIDKKDR